MKSRIYAEFYQVSVNLDEPKIYLDWYKHHNSHPYKGFTISFGFLGYTLIVNFVSNGKVYKDMMNNRWKRKK